MFVGSKNESRSTSYATVESDFIVIPDMVIGCSSESNENMLDAVSTCSMNELKSDEETTQQVAVVADNEPDHGVMKETVIYATLPQDLLDAGEELSNQIPELDSGDKNTVEPLVSSQSLRASLTVTQRRLPLTNNSLLPPGLSLCSFVIVTAVGTAVLVSSAFIAIPHTNAIKDHDAGRKPWWQCVAACSVVFSAFYSVIARHAAEIFMLAGSDTEKITICDMLAMWLSAGIGYALGYAGIVHAWEYPAPFGVFAGYAGFMIFFLCTTYVILRPKLQRMNLLSNNSNDAAEQISKISWWTASMGYGAVHLCVTLIIASLVNQMSGGALFLGAPGLALWRHVSAIGLSKIHTKLDAECGFLGDYCCWLVTGLFMVMIVGNSTDVYLAIFIFLVDVAEAMQAVTDITKAVSASRELPEGTVSNTLDALLEDSVSWLVVSEVGEVLIPGMYLMIWLAIFASPSGNAFAGIGVAELGSKVPKNMDVFTSNISLWFGLELLSVVAIHLYLKKTLNISIFTSARAMLDKYGMYMALLSINIIGVAFCMFMTSCGFDVSFRFEWMRKDHL
eukprot:GEMP01018163.1.p1 GENE.GEMP01018163.1~~GEMP01018163.1.p1  ORF type:complete len:563 (+),score=78.76 GEMP01018163.1:146-1834(+)